MAGEHRERVCRPSPNQQAVGGADPGVVDAPAADPKTASMTGLRACLALVCAAVVSSLCGGASPTASAAVSTCSSSSLTPSVALRDAIPRILDWEQSENLSPITLRLSRRAMQTEKPRKLDCNGGVCFIVWRAWPVSVWCSHGQVGVAIGNGGSPWATVPLPIIFWNSDPDQ